MTEEKTPMIAELDALIGSAGFPMRRETTEQAWNLTVDGRVSAEFHERVRRAIDHALPTGELMLLVTLRVRPGREHELVEAAQEFVDATRQLAGALGSTYYWSADDPSTFTLVERFSGRDALDRHMATDYFRRFQIVHGPLLERPIDAVMYQGVKG